MRLWRKPLYTQLVAISKHTAFMKRNSVTARMATHVVTLSPGTLLLETYSEVTLAKTSSDMHKASHCTHTAKEQKLKRPPTGHLVNEHSGRPVSRKGVRSGSPACRWSGSGMYCAPEKNKAGAGECSPCASFCVTCEEKKEFIHMRFWCQKINTVRIK